jgi:hypothetical protein
LPGTVVNDPSRRARCDGDATRLVPPEQFRESTPETKL